jgi:hypothetical protein
VADGKRSTQVVRIVFTVAALLLLEKYIILVSTKGNPFPIFVNCSLLVGATALGCSFVHATAHNTGHMWAESIDMILERLMLQGKDSDDEDKKMGALKPIKNSSASSSIASSSSTDRGSKTRSEGDQGDSKHSRSSTLSTKDLANQLPEDFKLGDFDVVCSRGKWAMNAPGNVRYRNIIRDNLQRYSATANKNAKSAIVSEIVASVKAFSQEGGFVRCVNGTWWTVTDHIAREKTGQVRLQVLLCVLYLRALEC